MLQRSTVLALARYFAASFWTVGGPQGSFVLQEEVQDFLYAGNYPQQWMGLSHGFANRIDLKNFVLWFADESTERSQGIAKLGALEATELWLKKLAIDLLVRDRDPEVPHWAKHPRERDKLLRQLELEGFAFIGGKLLPNESEALEVQEEKGELAATYAHLGLPNAKVVEEHLQLTDEHYADGRFHDSIGNARHYLEQVLRDVAATWSTRPGSRAFSEASKPVKVRLYLEAEKFWTTDEAKAFEHLYGLLSGTGGHPGISPRDQARIFRRLALAMAQYALLRFEAMTNPAS